MSKLQTLRKIESELDTASTAIITALAEARRTLGDQSAVTRELVHARIAVTTAIKAVESIAEGES